MNWIEATAIIAPIVTGAISWLAASKVRKSQAFTALQNTINQLAADNEKYLQRISELQQQLIEIKQQNVELKEGQRILEAEIKRLKEQ